MTPPAPSPHVFPALCAHAAQVLGTEAPRVYSQEEFLADPTEAAAAWLGGEGAARLVSRQLRVGADGVEVLSGAGGATGSETDLLHSWRGLVWSGSPRGKPGTLVLAFLVPNEGAEAEESSSDAAPAALQCHAFEVLDKFKLLEVRSLVEMLRAHDLAVQSGLAPQRPAAAARSAASSAQQQQQVQLREKGSGGQHSETTTSTKKKKRRSILGWRRKNSATEDDGEGGGSAPATADAADGEVQRRGKKKSAKGGGSGGKRRTSMLDMFSKLRFHKAKGSADLTAAIPMTDLSGKGGGGRADAHAVESAVMSAQPLSVQRRAIAASSIVARRVTSTDIGSSVIVAGWGAGRLAGETPNTSSRESARGHGWVASSPTSLLVKGPCRGATETTSGLSVQRPAALALC